jgi:hypothetical protein
VRRAESQGRTGEKTEQEKALGLTGGVGYGAPPLDRGDRASCLFRDCEVVVTGWTDALIPWPRCRAVDSPGPGSGLLVDEILAGAVQHESAAAVMYWWGVSQTAVKNFRRALGVGRTDSEESRRLIRAAAEKGAVAVQALEWTVEEREQCRQINAEHGLAANLVLGYHGCCGQRRTSLSPSGGSHH